MKKGKFAIGALIGAAAGLVAGILSAPKSGKETRQDVKKKANEVATEAIKDAKILADKADDIVADLEISAKQVVKDVKMNATDIKERTDFAIKGAKKGFTEKK